MGLDLPELVGGDSFPLSLYFINFFSAFFKNFSSALLTVLSTSNFFPKDFELSFAFVSRSASGWQAHAAG
jgi:hypothetical protein